VVDFRRASIARSGHPHHRRIVLDDTEATAPPVLLALDWTGTQEELLVGRHRGCDVVLSRSGVSRLHARLRFRDGSWRLQDLGSTNGTTLNGTRVGRCRLQPGDRLVFGDEHVTLD
jgi:predicted component of type VI protein secretion system